MAIKTLADGSIDVANSFDSISGNGSLLQAVLGKETSSDTTSDQSTAGTSSQTAAGTSSSSGSQGTVTAGTSNQAVSGASTSATTGSQVQTGSSNQATTGNTSGTGTSQQSQSGTSNTVTGTVQQGQQTQQSTGQQSTAGTTTTGGSTATTGTVTNSGSTTQQGTVDQRSTANVDALNEVYKRQASGITPEMLAAIFQQGAKAAPGLVVAQAGALGARGVGNSPMAQALNMLHLDLTSKAADINRQMLGDAGNTAAQIANATKGTSTSTDMTTSSLSTQVQDLLAKTDSTSIVNQLMSTLNNTVGNTSSTGTSTSAQATAGTTTGTTSNQTASAGNTSGTNSSTQQTQQGTTGTSMQNTAQSNAGTSQVNSSQVGATTQNTAGTTTQNVHATEAKLQQQTVNTSTVKSLAGLAAAGVGINELFKVATGKGFVGTIQELFGSLKGLGLSNINVSDAPGIDLSSVISAPSFGSNGAGGFTLPGDDTGGLGDLVNGLFGG